MKEFIELYRNPVFGILVLIFMVGVIAAFDFMRARQKERMRKYSIIKLGRKFENTEGMDNVMKDFINHIKDAYPTLLFIAQSYHQMGDYQKAITIYKTLNEQIDEQEKKLEILESLARTYYKAGLLQKSKKIFNEILAIYPHNTDVLEYYIYTSLSLKEYYDALNAILCIEELSIDSVLNRWSHEKIINTKDYINVMRIIDDYHISIYEKIQNLLNIYHSNDSIRWLILRYLRIHDLPTFWEKTMNIENPLLYLDIFWHIKKEDVDFDRINNQHIIDIYSAKGFIESTHISEHFELGVLQTLTLHGISEVDLSFSYQCQSCNSITPFYSYRCESCLELGKSKLLSKIIEKST